jgi:ABC-2 type transport system permease protein
MATTMFSTPRPQVSRNMPVIFFKEARYEFLKNLRLRAYSLSTILFPAMFYVLFGLILNRGNTGTLHMPSYFIATYGTFGVMGASLFGTAAGLAAERGLGWLQVKRASPMPVAAYFVAKIVMSMIFSTLVALVLMLLGTAFGGVRLSPAAAAELLAVLVLGSLPFCAMGLAIGYFAGPNSAPATINLIYLPLSFFSGLWVPLMFLPKVLRNVAHLLPPYHLSQIALSVFGAGQGEPNWSHWQYLAGFLLASLGVAYYGFRRDEGKLYG